MNPETEVILIASFVGSLAGGVGFWAVWTVTGYTVRLWRRCAYALARRRFLKAAQYPGRDE